MKFKTTMLKSDLCKYSDAYILEKGTITITGVRADAAGFQVDERTKQETVKNYALSMGCIDEINYMQVSR